MLTTNVVTFTQMAELGTLPVRVPAPSLPDARLVPSARFSVREYTLHAERFAAHRWFRLARVTDPQVQAC